MYAYWPYSVGKRTASAREKDRENLNIFSLSEYILKNKIIYLFYHKKVQDISKPNRFWKYILVFLHVEGKSSSSPFFLFD